MKAPSRTRPVPGIDVGKRSHWTCLVTAEGEIALNTPVANRERNLDELFSRAPGDALVVVDPVRNIWSLALKRAARGGREGSVGLLAMRISETAFECARLDAGISVLLESEST
jgi:hypothetical protein